MPKLVKASQIEHSILVIRGYQVLLDSHLAEFYGVSVGRLNEAVKRNDSRFPADFMFQLTKTEFENLKSQNAIASSTWGGRRTPPYAFTEQGVAMLSGVLRSKRPVQVNIAIMRAFVRLRHILNAHKSLARKIADLDRKYAAKTKEHEEHITRIYEVLASLMEPPPDGKRERIGFRER